jgi:hypothetical protein
MSAEANLAVFEQVAHGKANSIADLNVWLMCGGRERALDEFKSLLCGAGFELAETIATSPTHTMLLATPAAARSLDLARS